MSDPATPTVTPGARLARALRLVPAWIRHGRPCIPLAGAVISLLAIHLLPGQPGGPLPW